MGLETLLLATTLVGVGSTVLGTKAAVDQANAENDALYQQEVELNKIAAGESAESARLADKKAAEAIASMEAIGGYGSYNDTRLQLEMAGLKGLDLARIESNRSRQAAQLYAARRSIARGASNAIFQGMGAIAGQIGSFVGGKALLKANAAAKDFDLHATQNLASGS